MALCDASPALIADTDGRASFAYVVAGDDTVRAVALADIDSARPHCALLWVHVDGNDPACKAWLTERAHLEPGVVTALQAVETRPRATQLSTGAIVNLRGVGGGADCASSDLVSIRCYAEHGRVLTLTYRPLSALADLRACVEAGRVTDPGDFIAALADALTARLDPLVSELGDDLDALEEKLADGQFRIRDGLSRARRVAIELRRYIGPQKEAIARMASGEFVWLNDEDRGHIREAGDRVARMSEELESIRERAAVLADQLSDLRAEAMNARALVLSIVAAIFLPLTFLTGLFGMNVGGIPFAEHFGGFWIMGAVSAALGVALVLWFRHAGWFD